MSKNLVFRKFGADLFAPPWQRWKKVCTADYKNKFLLATNLNHPTFQHSLHHCMKKGFGHPSFSFKLGVGKVYTMKFDIPREMLGRLHRWRFSWKCKIKFEALHLYAFVVFYLFSRKKLKKISEKYSYIRRSKTPKKFIVYKKSISKFSHVILHFQV